MPAHVLVPVDGSEQGFAGLEYCFASFPSASITALYVVDPTHDHVVTVGVPDSPEANAEARGRRVLDDAVDRAANRDRTCRTMLRTGSPHTEILRVAIEEDVDHVVMGSHGESPITRPFLGHVSEAVIRRAPITTTVVPETTAELRNRTIPGRILVPVDGSEQSEAALTYALSAFPNGTHTAIHAIKLPFERSSRDAVSGTYLEEAATTLEEHGEAILESATAIADEHDLTLETDIAYGKPAAAILDYATENGFDQIVMGSHGRSLAARLITGSVAERVVRHSPRTATLVRGDPSN